MQKVGILPRDLVQMFRHVLLHVHNQLMELAQVQRFRLGEQTGELREELCLEFSPE